MVSSRLLEQIRDLVKEAIDDALEDWEDERDLWKDSSGRIGEAVSELDQVTADTWRYHLDNHPGPIAYCENKYCTYDRVSLVADILRGE